MLKHHEKFTSFHETQRFHHCHPMKKPSIFFPSFLPNSDFRNCTRTHPFRFFFPDKNAVFWSFSLGSTLLVTCMAARLVPWWRKHRKQRSRYGWVPESFQRFVGRYFHICIYIYNMIYVCVKRCRVCIDDGIHVWCILGKMLGDFCTILGRLASLCQDDMIRVSLQVILAFKTVVTFLLVGS